MRAAEAGHDTSELMERAGAGAAELALQIYSGAERWTVVCGGGSNGGDGRIVARHLLEAGKDVHVVDAKAAATELGEPHVIVDALFGTGFSGEPRAEAAALIEEIWRTGAHVLSIDLPSGVDASTGEIARRGDPRRRDRHVPRPQGRPRRRSRTLQRGKRARRRHRPRARRDGSATSRPSSCSGPSRGAPSATTSTRPVTCSSSAARAGSRARRRSRHSRRCARTPATSRLPCRSRPCRSSSSVCSRR